MKDDVKYQRWLMLKRQWDHVQPGMTLAQVESLMGMTFTCDSLNKAGRMVYSHHTDDYLPFYVVIDQATGLVMRRHNIKALDEFASTMPERQNISSTPDSLCR